MHHRVIAVGTAVLMSLALAACHRDRTVVVTPPANAAAPSSSTTVVNPPSNTTVVPGTTRVCPAGATTC